MHNMILYLIAIAAGLSLLYALNNYKDDDEAEYYPAWISLVFITPLIFLVNVLANIPFYLLVGFCFYSGIKIYRGKHHLSTKTIVLPDDVNNISFEYYQPKKQPELVKAQVFSIDGQYIRAHNIDKDKKQAYFAGWIKGLITDTDTNKTYSVADWLAAAINSPLISISHEKPEIKSRLIKSGVALQETKPIDFEKLSTGKIAQNFEPDKLSSDFRRVKFDYIDSKGDLSTREVRVDGFGRDKFNGFCMLRKASRTFKYDGIMSDIVDTETGEAISVETWKYHKSNL